MHSPFELGPPFLREIGIKVHKDFLKGGKTPLIPIIIDHRDEKFDVRIVGKNCNEIIVVAPLGFGLRSVSRDNASNKDLFINSINWLAGFIDGRLG